MESRCLEIELMKGIWSRETGDGGKEGEAVKERNVLSLGVIVIMMRDEDV